MRSRLNLATLRNFLRFSFYHGDCFSLQAFLWLSEQHSRLFISQCCTAMYDTHSHQRPFIFFSLYLSPPFHSKSAGSLRFFERTEVNTEAPTQQGRRHRGGRKLSLKKGNLCHVLLTRSSELNTFYVKVTASKHTKRHWKEALSQAHFGFGSSRCNKERAGEEQKQGSKVAGRVM